MTGAAFGYGLLWTALFAFPLMAGKLMCSRLGMITGRGLAAVVRRRYSRWVLWGACMLLTVASVINYRHGLGRYGGRHAHDNRNQRPVVEPAFAGFLVAMLVWTSYRVIARTFEWLTAVLFAYVVTAFLAKPERTQVLRATFVPGMRWSSEYLSVFVGVLGTSISPYLFFWQSSQEVEEERAEEDAGSAPGRNG